MRITREEPFSLLRSPAEHRQRLTGHHINRAKVSRATKPTTGTLKHPLQALHSVIGIEQIPFDCFIKQFDVLLARLPGLRNSERCLTYE